MSSRISPWETSIMGTAGIEVDIKSGQVIQNDRHKKNARNFMTIAIWGAKKWGKVARFENSSIKSCKYLIPMKPASFPSILVFVCLSAGTGSG